MREIRVTRPDGGLIWHTFVPDEDQIIIPFNVIGGNLHIGIDTVSILPPYRIEVGEWPEPKSFWQRAWTWIRRG